MISEGPYNSIRPVVNGLVLAGGKSTRMGHDKSIIKWHEQEQRYHMSDILRPLCHEVYISCRPEQQGEIDAAYKTLPDAYTAAGPYGAILSALQAQPDTAWLITACDLPLLDTETLKYLLQHRDATRIATTFESPFDGLPEPLVTIWEPRSFPVLLAFLSEGYKCPRKVLIRNSEQVKMIKAPNADALLNANTPEDAQKAKDIIDRKNDVAHAG